ncbi:MAG TPA: GntR family transcriptional regulator [Paracoccaceae bacterium]|nr:GntR family transcriptional regulator [Paracoccaceae bacterium]
MDRVTDPKQAAPRYQQVAADLQSRIEAGRYAVGAALPTEQELCVDYAVSRYTVREALRRLALQGLVRRRQGSGTEVIATQPPATYLHAMRSITELYEYAADTRLDILSAEVATEDDETNRMLGRRPGRAWLRMEALRRTRAGAPINVTRIWIHDDFAAVAPEIPGLPGPIHRLIEERYGAQVGEVVQEFAAEPFPEDAARLLGAAPGAPSVRLIRRYLGEGDRPLIVSISWHPAESFSYTMRLRREDVSG